MQRERLLGLQVKATSPFRISKVSSSVNLSTDSVTARSFIISNRSTEFISPPNQIFRAFCGLIHSCLCDPPLAVGGRVDVQNTSLYTALYYYPY